MFLHWCSTWWGGFFIKTRLLIRRCMILTIIYTFHHKIVYFFGHLDHFPLFFHGLLSSVIRSLGLPFFSLENHDNIPICMKFSIAVFNWTQSSVLWPLILWKHPLMHSLTKHNPLLEYFDFFMEFHVNALLWNVFFGCVKRCVIPIFRGRWASFSIFPVRLLSFLSLIYHIG